MSTNNGLLKNTFILSFVQIVNIVIKVLQNKIAAIVLGPSGMGVIGLFLNSISVISTGAGLGLSQSAVRDIAAADADGNADTVNKIFTVTNNMVYITGLLGLFITLILSYPLSLYVFGDSTYTLGFIVLSIAVFCNIVSEGRLAILKGLRRFTDLAKCTVYGALSGLIIVVPLYWYLKDKGIVWALLSIAFLQFVYINIYLKKVKYQKQNYKFKEIISHSKSMITMGVSLMIVSFVTIIFNLIITSIIRSGGDFVNVGIYTAGSTILTAYFNVIISAMSTDFYPRVSAVYNDNNVLKDLVNKQCLTCLSLIFPIVVIFVFAAPFFISFLYTDEFTRASEFTDYAMIGTVLIICSNFLGIILLAKRQSKVFLSSVISQRLFLLVVYYFCYKYWDIKGLGYAYIVTGLSDFLLMTIIMGCLHSIKLDKFIYGLLTVMLAFTFASMYIKSFENSIVKFAVGSILLLISLEISNFVFKTKLEINLVGFLKSKLKRK